MIDLYYAPTPNGQKISIMLEEIGFDYRIIAVNLLEGEQHEAEFLKISPYGKIPAIRDHNGPGAEPLCLFESGCILWYLADKAKKFAGSDECSRALVMQWLMFQMGNFGPMLGQAHHFYNYAPESIEYAQKRYARETERLYGILNDRLALVPYLAESYSIADMAVYPWVAARRAHRIDLSDYGHVRAWVDRVKQRPAVQRGFSIHRDQIPASMNAQHKKNLFGIEHTP